MPKASTTPSETSEPSPRKAVKPTASFPGPAFPASTPAKPTSVANYSNIARTLTQSTSSAMARNAPSPSAWGATPGSSNGDILTEPMEKLDLGKSIAVSIAGQENHQNAQIQSQQSPQQQQQPPQTHQQLQPPQQFEPIQNHDGLIKT